MKTSPEATIFSKALDEATRDRQDPLAPGTVLGDYRIVRLLGAGGMGVVYLADQFAPVRRQVAVKLLQFELQDSLGLAYFNVERQALAQMQHPAIAQVYDAGTTAQGHPYFVMEYVAGDAITLAADAESLDRAARIGLFIKLCMGVNHAHQKGVVHRDIKPSNVLVQKVDGELQPKLIDFGVALAAGAQDAPSTSARDRVGTAAYMSPEQAGAFNMDVDTRTDVYSLGIMLKDLLTVRVMPKPGFARPPTLSAQPRDVTEIRAHTADTALDDSALDPELRAITRKATAQNREMRYASAAALADDLQRYLRHERVLAFPDSRSYRLRQLVRRNRLGIGAAALALVGIIAGTIAAGYGLIEAREQRAAALESADLARLEAIKSAQIAKFMTEVFEGTDPVRAGALDKQLLRLILDEAVQRAARELKDSPTVSAGIKHSLGRAYRSIGEEKVALTLLMEAEALYEGAFGKLDQRTLQVATERLQTQVDQGDIKQAIVESQALYALSLARYGAMSETALGLKYITGYAQWMSGQPKEAEQNLRELLKMRTALSHASKPTTPNIWRLHSNLAAIYGSTGRFDEAMLEIELSIKQLEESLGADHASTLADRVVRASLNQRRQRSDLVIDDLGPRIARIREVFGTVHPTTVAAIANLGSALAESGKLDEAEPYYVEALATARKLYPPGNIRIAYTEHNFGNFQRRRGNFTAAVASQLEALKIAEASEASDPVFVGELYSSLAAAYLSLGQLEQSRDYRRRAIALFSDNMGAQHPRTLDEIADAKKSN